MPSEALASFVNSTDPRIITLLVGTTTSIITTTILGPSQYLVTATQVQDLGPRNVLKKTWNIHGIRGFYRGFTPLLISRTFKSVLNLYDPISPPKEIEALIAFFELEQTPFHHKTVETIALSAMVVPLENVQVKMIHENMNAIYKGQPRQYKGIFSGFKLIIEKYGVSGLYKGLPASALKYIATTSILTEAHGPIRKLTEKVLPPISTHNLEEQKQHQLFTKAIMMSFSGLLQIVAVTPFEVVRVRMQGLEGVNYRNSLDCVKDLWKRYGIRGFYKAASVHTVMSAFTVVAVYGYNSGRI